MSMKDLARDPRQVGNLVRRARKKQGLSQSQLGDKAGLRQETISLIETGHPAAKLQTILGILAALDLERARGEPIGGQRDEHRVVDRRSGGRRRICGHAGLLSFRTGGGNPGAGGALVTPDRRVLDAPNKWEQRC